MRRRATKIVFHIKILAFRYSLINRNREMINKLIDHQIKVFSRHNQHLKRIIRVQLLRRIIILLSITQCTILWPKLSNRRKYKITTKLKTRNLLQLDPKVLQQNKDYQVYLETEIKVWQNQLSLAIGRS